MEELTSEFVTDIMQKISLTTADSCVYELDALLESKTWWSMRGESGELMAYRAPDKKKNV
jgi:hypothetical protein